MNTKNFIKEFCLIPIIIILVTIIALPSYAQMPPPDGYPIHWTEMGEFDQNGNFIWNGDFKSEVEDWIHDNFRGADLPTITKSIEIEATLHNRRFNITTASNPKWAPGARLQLAYPMVITYPDIHRLSTGELFIKLQSPEFNTYSLHTERNYSIAETPVVAVKWVERGLIAQTPGVDVIHVANYWENYGYAFSLSSPYLNFWQPSSPQPLSPYYYHFFFFFNQYVDIESDQTFELTLQNNTKKIYKFHAHHVDPMPQIPATIVNKDKKYEKVPNIVVKELDGDLIIKWPEPDMMLKKGYRLYVYFTNSKETGGERIEIATNLITPPQMGVAVLPADAWAGLKNDLLAAGFTEAILLLIYDAPRTDDTFKTTYVNRGTSDPIRLPIQ